MGSSNSTSRLEQLIDEIEDYIDSCKYQHLSKINKIVNKDEIDELLDELRRRTPEEIEAYRKVIAQREEIIQGAKDRAEKLLNDATDRTNKLINEHEIMQQAYAQANEVVTLATEQAQQIVDEATIEANNVKEAAMRYLDDMLAHLDNIMVGTINTTNAHYESFISAINGYHDIVAKDLNELHPVENLIDEISQNQTNNDAK